MIVILAALLTAIFGPQLYRELKRHRVRRAVTDAGSEWPGAVGVAKTGTASPSTFFAGGVAGDGWATSAPYLIVAFDDSTFVARQINALGRDPVVVVERSQGTPFQFAHLPGGRRSLCVAGRPVEIRSRVDKIATELVRRGWSVDGVSR